MLSIRASGTAHEAVSDLCSRYLARRYPLGVAGAVIMAVFVFAAVFADAIAPLDPLTTNAALVAGAAGRHAICWAPTSWAATSTAASSTARASRSLSALGATCLGCGLGVAARPGLAAMSAAGSICSCSACADIMQALPLLVHGAGDDRRARPVAASTPSSPSPSR